MSDAPAFLSVEQVAALHRVALERHGGPDGLRDPAAFESAVMQPRNVWFYAQGDLFDVAAAYALERHPTNQSARDQRVEFRASTRSHSWLRGNLNAGCRRDHSTVTLPRYCWIGFTPTRSRWRARMPFTAACAPVIVVMMQTLWA